MELGDLVLPATYLQWPQSHTFANDRLKALETVLTGLRAHKTHDELDDKFDDLWKDLKGYELITAAPLIDRNQDLPSVAKEITSFRRRLAHALIDRATWAYAERNFPAMDETLKQLEGFQSADLANEQRSEIARLRRLWQSMRGNPTPPR